MIDSQKTNFSKMALSLRQNNMNPNPLALFHDICRHIKCHLRNQNRRKFHFSNMGPHCVGVSDVGFRVVGTLHTPGPRNVSPDNEPEKKIKKINVVVVFE